MVFVLANTVYPDKMPRNAAFHLGFHLCQSTRLVVTSRLRVNFRVSFFVIQRVILNNQMNKLTGVHKLCVFHGQYGGLTND